MKCLKCGNDKFVAHQLVRMDIVVDENNNFLEQGEIYDSETPYGPYTCTKCGKEYDNIKTSEYLERCCANCTHCREYYSAGEVICHNQNRKIAETNDDEILFRTVCSDYIERDADDDIGNTLG